MQSIEDLISDSHGDEVDERSAVGKFRNASREIKIKEAERSTKSTANYLGVPYIDLINFPISPEAISLIREEESAKQKIICFFYDGASVRVATTDYNNPEVHRILKDICEKNYVNGKIYLISEHSFAYAIDMYRMLPKIRKFVSGVEIKEEDLEKFKKDIGDYKSLEKKINEVSISDVVTLILATALKTDSSDIHIEAEEFGIVTRLRIDGVLQEAAVIDKEKWKKIISRMKLLAKVKINIEGRPQDGRFSIFLKDEKLDVRVSFLPTAFGESVVMRLLRSSSVGLPFEDLGINQTANKILLREIQKPNGMILTTGPTGSGKTTSLYAILNKLNDSETKIITLENPVEYQLKGINQSQIDPSKNYTFAKGLRAILRQDPDIVMVGEIRDLETAEIAIQAGLTGHLVLSTLHTNDASGVIPRLIDMGVKPYFLTPAINAVIGQRLVRKLCPKCREEHIMTELEKEQVEKILAVISPKAEIEIPSDLPVLYKVGKGCEHCVGVGYKGRIGIYEIFTMDDNIKKLAMDNAPAFQILQQAIENGMLTMLQDGILKVMNGQTSLEEVYRVIGKFDYIDELYEIVVSNVIGRGIKLKQEELDLAQELSKNFKEAGSAIKKANSQEMLNTIVALALFAEAGDIHIEPKETAVSVRFRVDGILHEVTDISKEHYIQILSKMKVLAGFATNVKKATMDGRFNIVTPTQRMDCRLSIISGGYGETIVVRILANQASALDMEKLGIRSSALTSVKRSMNKTKGIIINTGPTGSGKTTTLYSILNNLNKPDIKIITIEDPIEYHMDGVIQTQIDTDKGYTFAAAIRSLMRQNPNIIMVGEIRDPETAKVAIEASMTGHLVLSTIHANSAAGAIARFVGLGVDRQALASSIECTMGQRLVRRICPYCKVEDNLSSERLEQVKIIINEIKKYNKDIQISSELKFYKGVGCEKCGGVGYKGRLGVYEIIEMQDNMQKLIQSSLVTNVDIERLALENGTILMLQDGILKALAGETSVEEVFRVVN